MKTPSMIAVTLLLCAHLARAEEPKALQLGPDDIKFVDAPPALPAGTRSALLEGDPKGAGIVTMRFLIPKGARVAVHTHPTDERVTVLKGVVHVSFGDEKSARAFPAGSYYVNPKGVQHSVWVDEETLIQITVQGPWGINFVTAPAPR